MTKWLDKLTSHNLSGVDTEGCNSIDEWIDRLDEQTPLEVITSSGTTGTLSIIPKDKHGAREGMVLWKICLFQTFGTEPTDDELNPAVDVIWPNYAKGKLGHLRIANMIRRGFTGGDESKFHALYPDAIDTDLMFLASKMRAAASRGELDRLVIDPALAARKDEFIAMQARQPEDLDRFFTTIAEKLCGKRVFMIGTYNLMYDVAKAGLDRGIKQVFAKDSAILTGGGTKGFVLPDTYMDVIGEFLGVDRIQQGYGFSEQSAFHWGCSEGRYHVQPWVIPFVLDPDTSEPLPRTGRQTGRAAVYDVLLKAHWGANVLEIADSQVGLGYLNGWVAQTLGDGRELRVRAFGSRVLHIPAGNGGLVSAVTILRSVITRCDTIIKAPSNDPLTAVAIARTLADVAPDHPITRHLAVGYWKGGDVAVEEPLYRPEHIEKIVAWGGFASVKHVTRYIQPGLEMIALDPKRSATIIGHQAFDDEETMREVARCAAVDIGVANQEGCANARVLYVMSGTDAAGIANANKLGEMIYEELTRLPAVISTPPLSPSRELYDHVEASRMTDDWYRVIGGDQREGAIIVSQFDAPVDYSAMLSGRVANVVPVADIDKVTEAVTAYTQTIGIYPESLKRELRDKLPLFGAQRLTTLGYACSVPIAAPQDAIEPMRRMCKWIVEEACDPDVVTPLWRLGEPAAQA